MNVAVLDHGMGNLRSVQKALEAAGATRAVVTSDVNEIDECDALCVPGQGIFGRCVSNLRAGGLDDLIRDWVDNDRPYLGICLGMQVLFEGSEERGPVEGLGMVEGTVRKLDGSVRVPHIGWNTVGLASRRAGPLAMASRRAGPLALASRRAGPPSVGEDYFYFDHSYAAVPSDDSIVTGWTEHGGTWASRIEVGSILGVQFHPEKSGRQGVELLGGWLSDKEFV